MNVIWILFHSSLLGSCINSEKKYNRTRTRFHGVALPPLMERKIRTTVETTKPATATTEATTTNQLSNTTASIKGKRKISTTRQTRRPTTSRRRVTTRSTSKTRVNRPLTIRPTRFISTKKPSYRKISTRRRTRRPTTISRRRVTTRSTSETRISTTRRTRRPTTISRRRVTTRSTSETRVNRPLTIRPTRFISTKKRSNAIPDRNDEKFVPPGAPRPRTGPIYRPNIYRPIYIQAQTSPSQSTFPLIAPLRQTDPTFLAPFFRPESTVQHVATSRTDTKSSRIIRRPLTPSFNNVFHFRSTNFHQIDRNEVRYPPKIFPTARTITPIPWTQTVERGDSWKPLFPPAVPASTKRPSETETFPKIPRGAFPTRVSNTPYETRIPLSEFKPQWKLPEFSTSRIINWPHATTVPKRHTFTFRTSKITRPTTWTRITERKTLRQFPNRPAPRISNRLRATPVPRNILCDEIPSPTFVNWRHATTLPPFRTSVFPITPRTTRLAVWKPSAEQATSLGHSEFPTPRTTRWPFLTLPVRASVTVRTATFKLLTESARRKIFRKPSSPTSTSKSVSKALLKVERASLPTMTRRVFRGNSNVWWIRTPKLSQITPTRRSQIKISIPRNNDFGHKNSSLRICQNSIEMTPFLTESSILSASGRPITRSSIASAEVELTTETTEGIQNGMQKIAFGTNATNDSSSVGAQEAVVVEGFCGFPLYNDRDRCIAQDYYFDQLSMCEVGGGAITFGVLVALFGLATVISNCILPIVVWRGRSPHEMRTQYDYVKVSLAMADILQGFVLLGGVIPSIFKLRSYSEAQAVVYIKSDTNSVAAILIGALTVVSAQSSLLHLMFLSIERFVAIKWPLRHKTRKTSTVVAILVCLWISSMLCSFMPAAFPQYFEYKFQPALLIHMLTIKLNSNRALGIEGPLYVLFILLIPFMIMVIFCVLTSVVSYKKLKSRRRKLGTQKRNTKTSSKDKELKSSPKGRQKNRRLKPETSVFVTIIVMIIAFSAALLPFTLVVFLFMGQVLNCENYTVPYVISFYVGMLNGIANPIIYTMRGKKFRSAVVSVFCPKLLLSRKKKPHL